MGRYSCSIESDDFDGTAQIAAAEMVAFIRDDALEEIYVHVTDHATRTTSVVCVDPRHTPTPKEQA